MRVQHPPVGDGGTHATNAPVSVRPAGGASLERRISLALVHGKWVKLGTIRCAAGKPVQVTLTNDANANVVADAVKLVPVR